MSQTPSPTSRSAALSKRTTGLTWPALGIILACLMALPAAAGYVFFYQLHDDWAVLCWRDQASDQKSCRLNAPPAGATGAKPGTRRRACSACLP